MADVLTPDEVAAALARLDGWSGEETGIRKTYRFADFAQAMAFTNRVADAAEEANHHPDIDIRWNKVTLAIVSHAKGGVTPACVALATEADAASNRP